MHVTVYYLALAENENVPCPKKETKYRVTKSADFFVREIINMRLVQGNVI